MSSQIGYSKNIFIEFLNANKIIIFDNFQSENGMMKYTWKTKNFLTTVYFREGNIVLSANSGNLVDNQRFNEIDKRFLCYLSYYTESNICKCGEC